MGFVFQFVSDTNDGRRRWAVPLASAVLALLVGGCSPGSSGGSTGGGHGGGGHEKVDVSVLPSKPSKPMTVQQLAAGVGCTAETEKYKDYRQLRCDLERQSFILVDFDTDDDLRVWLDHSTDYGGFYLVGQNWVVSGNTLAEISPLQEKFGGRIEEGDNHGEPPPSSRPPAN